MGKIRFISIMILIIGSIGCAATLPPPQPADPQRAAIGIAADMRAFGFTYSCDQVYFIKIDEGEDLYTQGSLIQSNYSKGGQVYLLNAKPGRYAVVAIVDFKKVIIPAATTPSSGISISFTPRSDYSYTTFLPKDVIKLTEATAAPGTMQFAGKYVVDAAMGFEDADDAQLHYLQLVAPGAKTDFLSMGFSGRVYYKGSLYEEYCDKQAEIEFLNNALEHFKDTGWAKIINKRTKDLKKDIQIAAPDIEKPIGQRAKATDQLNDKQKLRSAPATPKEEVQVALQSSVAKSQYETPLVNVSKKSEIWVLEISGNTKGKLEMMLDRIKIGEDKYSISGNISGIIRDYRWGLGTADYKLNGKIENNKIEASFSGLSDMAEGPSSSNGNIRGTLSDFKGSGSWNISIHARGGSEGTFTMNKIEYYYLYSGHSYYKKGLYDQAVSDYNRAIEMNPNFAKAYLNRGAAYRGQGEYDKAISDYTKALDIGGPEVCYMALVNRGYAYQKSGHYEEAIADFTKAIQMNQKLADAYVNRGLVYMVDLGVKDKACIDWKRACELGHCKNYEHAVKKGDCELDAPYAERLDNSKTSSGSVSETQIAAISLPKIPAKEPWTGIWKVEGSAYSQGQWGMKQTGSKVASTKHSYYELKGNVKGSQLKGRIIADLGVIYNFVVHISSDGQSFEGKIDDYWGTAFIKGKRID